MAATLNEQPSSNPLPVAMRAAVSGFSPRLARDVRRSLLLLEGAKRIDLLEGLLRTLPVERMCICWQSEGHGSLCPVSVVAEAMEPRAAP